MSAIDTTTSHKKAAVRITLIATLILAVPLVAMQFSEEADWGLYDFIATAILVFGTGMIYVFLIKKFRTTVQQMVAIAILLTALLLIWAELAVGVFGSPFAGS